MRADAHDDLLLQFLLQGLHVIQHSDGALVSCEQVVEVIVLAFVHDVRRRLRESLLHVTTGKLGWRASGDEMPEVGGRLIDRGHVLHVRLEWDFYRLIVSDGRVDVAPCPAGDERVEFDLSEIVRRNTEVSVLVMPVPRSTITRRLDFENSKATVLPLQDAVERGTQVWLLAADELLIRTVSDQHLGMLRAETLPQFVFQGIALDHRPLVRNVLRLHAAGLLKPKLIRRLESVQAEDRAHVTAAHTGLPAFQPGKMPFDLLALFETLDRVTLRVLEGNTLHFRLPSGYWVCRFSLRTLRHRNS